MQCTKRYELVLPEELPFEPFSLRCALYRCEVKSVLKLCLILPQSSSALHCAAVCGFLSWKIPDERRHVYSLYLLFTGRAESSLGK